MIALAVLGLLAFVAVTNLPVTSPKKERTQMVASLNRLLHRAWRGAVTKQQRYEVHVDATKNVVWLRTEAKDITTATGRAEFKLPRHIVIKNFYIGDKDEMRGHGGRATTEMWFYIAPEGIAQRVIMNIIDRRDTGAGRAGTPVGLVLNPFTVQFTEHDTFQQP